MRGCTIYGGHTTADPKLGRLQGNGGPTETHTLLPGSPAIDAGDPGGCRDRAGALVATDQRGFARPAVGCDLGAYEAPEPGAAALGVSALAAVWLCGTGGKRAARA